MKKLMFAAVAALACAGAQAVTVGNLAELRAAIADGATEITIPADTTIDLSADGQGPIVLPQNAMLKGENRETSVISGGGKTNCLVAAAAGVRIEGLTFRDGFGGYLYVSGSTHHRRGGGLYIAGSGAVISNCVIRDCVASDTNLSSQYHRICGGGLYLAGGGILVDSIVSNCWARYDGSAKPDISARIFGGGVYLDGASTVTNCEIAANVSHDGYLHMAYDNQQNCSGGGLALFGGSTCVGSVIARNICSNNFNTADVASVWQSGGHGGGIYIGGAATLKACLLEKNLSSRYGGGLCVQSDANIVTIDACSFIENSNVLFSSKETNNQGGGGARLTGSKITMTRCLFETNISTTAGAARWGSGLGGGIYLDNFGAGSVIRDSLIRGCKAYNGGGMCVHNSNSSGLVTGCVFDGDEAGWASGGFRVDAYDGFRVESCIFKDCYSPSMASVCWQSQIARKHLYFRSCFFTGCSGAPVLYLQNYSALSFVHIQNCTFANNPNVQAISFDWEQSNTNTYISGCVFYGNKGDIATGNDAYPLSATTNVTYSYVGTWDAKFPRDTEKQALHNLNSDMLTDGIEAQFVDAANGDFRLKKKSQFRGAGGGVADWMGTGKRNSVLDCGDGTWTEAPVQTIAVNGRICDVGVDLKINNRKPRVYNDAVDIGCFQYFCPPGLMLLMK